MWKPEQNFRRRHQQCSCHDKVSGPCLALTLVSGTIFFMFIAFAVENIGTDIHPPQYENSLVQSPRLKVKTPPDLTDEFSQDSTTKAFCNMFECPSGYVIDVDRALSQCTQYPCVVDECCQNVQSDSNVLTTSENVPNQAFCNMFLCPNGYTIWEELTNAQCTNYPCSVGECCVIDESQFDVSDPHETLEKPQWGEYRRRDNNNNNNGNGWDGGNTGWNGPYWNGRRWYPRKAKKTFPYGGDGSHYRRAKNPYYGYGNNNNNNNNNNQNGYNRNRNGNPEIESNPASCSMFDCPDGFARFGGNPAEMQCKGSTCLVKECCALVQSNYNTEQLAMDKSPSKAFCNMFDCPNGYTRLDGNPGRAQCTNNPCLVQECCAMSESNFNAEAVKQGHVPSEAFCDMFFCPEGFTKLQGYQTTMACSQYPCSVGECCVVGG